MGGKNERVQSIGDEPENGPDIYYILRNFESPGILNLLQEECDIQVNAVMTLLEGTKTDMETSTNNSFLALRDYSARSPDASLWKNLVWTSVEGAESQEPRELFDKIAAKVYLTLHQKKSYDAFYASDTFLLVPDVDPNALKRHELRYHDSLLNAVSNQRAVTEDLVLGVALEQLTRSLILEEELPEPATSDCTIPLPEEAIFLQNHFEKAVKKLAVTLSDGKEHNELAASEPQSSPCVFNFFGKCSYCTEK